jgi:hypothetical protein
MEAQEAPLPRFLRASLLEAFALFDADRDGRITFAELGTVLRSVGFQLTNSQLRALTKRLLPTHFGYLTRADLLDLCATLPTGPAAFAPRTPAQALAHLRAQLAQGALAHANSVQLLCTTGEGLSAQEYAALAQVSAASLRHGFAPS